MLMTSSIVPGSLPSILFSTVSVSLWCLPPPHARLPLPCHLKAERSPASLSLFKLSGDVHTLFTLHGLLQCPTCPRAQAERQPRHWVTSYSQPSMLKFSFLVTLGAFYLSLFAQQSCLSKFKIKPILKSVIEDRVCLKHT